MDEQDYLPAAVIFPAQPGWRVHYISRDDKPEDLEDFLHRPADMVIAWHSTVDAWTRPVVAGEQFAFSQEYILRGPEGSFVTESGGSYKSLAEAFRAIRPEQRNTPD